MLPEALLFITELDPIEMVPPTICLSSPLLFKVVPFSIRFEPPAVLTIVFSLLRTNCYHLIKKSKHKIM